MSEDSDFFDDVFDDPDDDPLLGGSPEPSDDLDAESGDPSAGSAPSEEPERQGPPSWMSDEPNTNGTAFAPNGTEPNGAETSDPSRKQIVVDQEGDAGAGIDALNQAVGQGWRLVRIFLARPTGQQAATPQAAHRFVAILEQDRPQSLFDFGKTA